jgi:hypothetical protein
MHTNVNLQERKGGEGVISEGVEYFGWMWWGFNQVMVKEEMSIVKRFDRMCSCLSV